MKQTTENSIFYIVTAKEIADAHAGLVIFDAKNIVQCEKGFDGQYIVEIDAKPKNESIQIQAKEEEKPICRTLLVIMSLALIIESLYMLFC